MQSRFVDWSWLRIEGRRWDDICWGRVWPKVAQLLCAADTIDCTGKILHFTAWNCQCSASIWVVWVIWLKVDQLHCIVHWRYIALHCKVGGPHMLWLCNPQLQLYHIALLTQDCIALKETLFFGRIVGFGGITSSQYKSGSYPVPTQRC